MSRVPSSSDGRTVNEHIFELWADGRAHCVVDLEPALKARGLHKPTVMAALSVLRNKGAVNRTGPGTYQLKKGKAMTMADRVSADQPEINNDRLPMGQAVPWSKLDQVLAKLDRYRETPLEDVLKASGLSIKEVVEILPLGTNLGMIRTSSGGYRLTEIGFGRVESKKQEPIKKTTEENSEQLFNLLKKASAPVPFADLKKALGFTQAQMMSALRVLHEGQKIVKLAGSTYAVAREVKPEHAKKGELSGIEALRAAALDQIRRSLVMGPTTMRQICLQTRLAPELANSILLELKAAGKVEFDGENWALPRVILNRREAMVEEMAELPTEEREKPKEEKPKHSSWGRAEVLDMVREGPVKRKMIVAKFPGAVEGSVTELLIQLKNEELITEDDDGRIWLRSHWDEDQVKVANALEANQLLAALLDGPCDWGESANLLRHWKVLERDGLVQYKDTYQGNDHRLLLVITDAGRKAIEGKTFPDPAWKGKSIIPAWKGFEASEPKIEVIASPAPAFGLPGVAVPDPVPEAEPVVCEPVIEDRTLAAYEQFLMLVDDAFENEAAWFGKLYKVYRRILAKNLEAK